MQKARCSFSVVVLEGKIYAIGGHCESEHMESVERYCPATNSWRYFIQKYQSYATQYAIELGVCFCLDVHNNNLPIKKQKKTKKTY